MVLIQTLLQINDNLTLPSDNDKKDNERRK